MSENSKQPGEGNRTEEPLASDMTQGQETPPIPIPELMKQIGKKVVNDLTRAHLKEIQEDPETINPQARQRATSGQCVYLSAMAGIAL